MNPMLTDEQKIVAASDQVRAVFGDEVAILGLGNGTYYSLNLVGAYVWRLIRQPMSFGDICQAVLAEYDVEPDRCRREIEMLIQDLAKNKLVEIDS